MKGSVLVIGGGIAGIQASLDLADQDFKVYLVEKTPSIGGMMARLDKTLPTNDCSICIEAPKMVEVARHPNIELLTYSEVRKVEGKVGDFKISVHRKPRFVDEEKCTGCGACTDECPIKVESEFDVGLAQRKAIYIPFPQAVPNVATIDAENCTYFKTGRCRLCEKACVAEAINYEQEGVNVELEVGCIIVATGFEEFDPTAKRELGFGTYKNVLTSLQFERLLSASGPTGGRVIRPSDGKVPKKIAWIQCVGARDHKVGNPYCSRVCCMWATKEAIIAIDHNPDIEAYIFYVDIKANGKGFEEYYTRAKKQVGVRYIRGKPARVIQRENGNLKLIYENTEGGEVEELEVEMLVLTSAIVPSEGNGDLAKVLGIELDDYGFFMEKDPITSPMETGVEGIYLCGCASGPIDIPGSTVQASAAAAKAIASIHEARGTETRTVELPPLKDVGSADARVGVFVCHCGINIGGYVDVPSVAEYAEGLPNVVYSTHNLFTCSEATQVEIKEAIKRHDLNRVVVAACTPRTHEPLFAATCRQAGLNNYLFTMVNIREQCSWVHSHESERATEKAKELVRMAVARSRLLTPLEDREVGVIPESLVIGGGIAGMSAALELANMGFQVHLVEREMELGGLLRKLNRLFPTDESAEEIVNEKIRAVRQNENITVYTNAQIAKVRGYIGDYEVVVSRDGLEKKFNVGTVIIATGSKEIDARGYYGHGEYQNVITQMELEQMLREQRMNKDLERVVMINCVGSREDEEEGGKRTYCCKIGCDVSIKNAKYVKERYPNADVYILYRDMRITEKKGEEYYDEVRGRYGVNFIKYSKERKPMVSSNDEKLKVKVYNVLLGEEQEIEADLVVLTVPMEGPWGTEELSKMLKVPIGVGNFFQEAHVKLRPLDFATDGIYLCGCAHSPKGVGETVSQAIGAAARASIPMGRGHAVAQAVTAVVDLELCVGCGSCIPTCPYNAISTKIEDGRLAAAVNPLLCKGCGVCAVACPANAMEMQNFTDNQIIAQISAATDIHVDEDEPNIIGFCCNWCSYAGADMAGVSRFQYPPNMKIIRVMCSGRVDPIHILWAFLNGADGVFVSGCHPADCHYVQGNEYARQRIENLKALLKRAGVNPERLRLEWVSASEGKRFADLVTEFTSQIKELGPSPIRMRGGVSG
ncbi:MAG: hydrogenase iron-sulfur subunit [Candidatus Geothermarchaeales archaeon]